MHNKGVFHRDLKAENIFLSKDLVLKIADFGYSKNKSEMSGNLTTTQVGTKSYMPPELIAGKPYSPAKADIFAAGKILFLMYAGYPAFGSATPQDPWYKLLI